MRRMGGARGSCNRGPVSRRLPPVHVHWRRSGAVSWARKLLPRKEGGEGRSLGEAHALGRGKGPLRMAMSFACFRI